MAAVLTPRRTLAALILAAGTGLGLASTNPGPEEFQDFAGERLTRLLSDELCHEDGMPMLARLVIQDCPRLVESQRQVLGRLAVRHSRRINLGLLSIYTTEMGGQQVLPAWRLPRYTATTLAAAGQFLLLEAGEDRSGGRTEVGGDGP